MNRCVNPSTWLLAFCVALAGCSSADEPLVEAAPAVASPAPVAVEAARPAVGATPTPDLAKPEPAAASPPVAQFVPPFPERLDLFEPLKRAQSMVRRDDEHGQTVELKGFINIDQPLVVLSIDGVISSIPEGGEKYGVQVESIDPPNVILKRGNDRWPATLE